MMQDVPEELFTKAGVRPVCGFTFRYDPSDLGYGIGVVTDGTIPPLMCLEAALDVGRLLQKILLDGRTPRPPGRIFLEPLKLGSHHP